MLLMGDMIDYSTYEGMIMTIMGHMIVVFTLGVDYPMRRYHTNIPLNEKDVRTQVHLLIYGETAACGPSLPHHCGAGTPLGQETQEALDSVFCLATGVCKLH